jgi:hypothetical protein
MLGRWVVSEDAPGGRVNAIAQLRGVAYIELVASCVNRSHLWKSWETVDTYALRTAGAHGQKNTAITRIPRTLCQRVGRIFLTAPLWYKALALPWGQCDMLLRYGKLATSAL